MRFAFLGAGGSAPRLQAGLENFYPGLDNDIKPTIVLFKMTLDGNTVLERLGGGPVGSGLPATSSTPLASAGRASVGCPDPRCVALPVLPEHDTLSLQVVEPPTPQEQS
jgi:hypothetical protein